MKDLVIFICMIFVYIAISLLSIGLVERKMEWIWLMEDCKEIGCTSIYTTEGRIDLK